MRILIQTSPARGVPFLYPHWLVGLLHRWWGENVLHDAPSLYSFSALHGSIRRGDVLDFPNGARWFASFHDEELARRVVAAIMSNSTFIAGMHITDIHIQPTPVFPSSHRFATASPVLLRRKNATGVPQYLLYSNPHSDDALTVTMQRKMHHAGFSAEDCGRVRVRFDRSDARAKTKVVTMNNVHNRASACPVIVEGSPEAVAFAWNVGVGHSTGAGFGALR